MLAAKGLEEEALKEMDKDIARLQVVAERFSDRIRGHPQGGQPP